MTSPTRRCVSLVNGLAGVHVVAVLCRPLSLGMVALGLLASTPAAGATLIFEDLSTDLPVSENFTAVTLGPSENELWVGTEAGRVYRSHNAGRTFEQMFEPVEREPVVVPLLSNIRAATVGDLARGTERDVERRDRIGRAQRQADITGDLRERPRDRGAPLLSSLVRPASREPVAITRVAHCHRAIYIASEAGLWRSHDDGLTFHALRLEPLLDGGVKWVGCDAKRPGHLIAVTGQDLLETLDGGDSFARSITPLPRALRTFTADFDDEGRLLVVADRKVFRQRASSGFELVCEFAGTSVASDRLSWAWWLPSGRTYAVTGDGVLVCQAGGVRHLSDPRLYGPIRYLWVDSGNAHHLYVATRTTVFESFDDGATFTEIFTVPTQRSIVSLVGGRSSDDILVVTGGQIFRRVEASGTHQTMNSRHYEELARQTPLAQVVNTALARTLLLPEDLESHRVGARLRNLLPVIALRYVDRSAGLEGSSMDARGVQNVFADSTRTGDVWTAFVLWDLSALWLDPVQVGATWADLERLRSQLTYRVQDTYIQWIRYRAALADPSLPFDVRLDYTLRTRESAAYLRFATGNAFAAFSEDL